MRLGLAFSVLLFLGTAQFALGHDTQGAWQTETPLPAPRAEVAVAAYHGEVYVIAGVGPGGPVNTLFIYNTATETWREGAPVPGPARDHVAAAFLNGKLYATGGLTYWPGGGIADVYAYDPLSDSWAPRAPLPRPRGGHGAAVIAGRLYAVGGLVAGNAVNELTVYDPAANQWTTLPPMPTPRDHLMVAALQGKLYTVGGRNRDIGALVNVNEVFDPETGQWATKAPLPTARGGGGAAVLHGLLYVFGGEFDGGTFANNEAYDPRTDSWHAHAPLPTARHGTQGAVVAGRIYVPGGGPEAGFSSSDLVDSYFSPPEPTQPPAEDATTGEPTGVPGGKLEGDPSPTPEAPSDPETGDNGAPRTAGTRTDDTGGCNSTRAWSPLLWLLAASLASKLVKPKTRR